MGVRIRACLFAVLAVVLATHAAAAPAPDAPGVRGDTGSGPRADLALSASFLPPRFIVGNAERRERVRALLQARVLAARAAGDSTLDFSLERGVLKLSPELLERLADEDDEGGRWKATSRRAGRARARLEKLAGPGIEEDAPAYPASYV